MHTFVLLVNGVPTRIAARTFTQALMARDSLERAATAKGAAK